MAFYTRRQIVLLLVLVGAVGLGLLVGQMRRTHPELVDRLEQLDRAEPRAPALSPPQSPASERPAAAKRRLRAADPSPPRKLRTPAPDGEAPQPLDLNRASVRELMRLPGVGRAFAARIVESREVGGPFTSVDDLRRVGGLGRAKLERFRVLITVD